MSDVTCERCGQNPAVLRLTQIVRGVPVGFRLCEKCAAAGDLAFEGPFRCVHCGRDYGLVVSEILLEQGPAAAMFYEGSFRQWAKCFACWICGEHLFPL